MNRTLVIAASCLLFAGVSSTVASAEELPTRKAGLWDLKILFEGGRAPPQTMQHCVDAQSDKLMNSSFGGMAKEGCTKQDLQRSGDTLTMDSVCKTGDATTTSHAVITGDFNSAFQVKMTSKHEGGPKTPGLPPTTSMTVEAKWLGPCKAGQKPGDIMMSNGMKFNVLDLKSGIPPRH